MGKPPRRASSLYLIATLLLTTACIATTSPPSAVSLAPPAECGGKGRVELQQLENSARGYAYNFAVYLPPCYDAEPERDYPVLYLVPGRGGSPSAWFDAGATAIVDELVLSGQIAPLIVVGTENTNSDPFGSAILDELMPHIETTYRVARERAFTAVAGGSLGGVAAYRLAFTQPGRFSSAGIFGSGLIAGEEEQFSTMLAALPDDQRPRVFLNSGEQDPYMLDRARVLEAYLAREDIETTMLIGPGGHEYSYWLSNLPAFLIWVAEDWGVSR